MSFIDLLESDNAGVAVEPKKKAARPGFGVSLETTPDMVLNTEQATPYRGGSNIIDLLESDGPGTAVSKKQAAANPRPASQPVMGAYGTVPEGFAVATSAGTTGQQKPTSKMSGYGEDSIAAYNAIMSSVEAAGQALTMAEDKTTKSKVGKNISDFANKYLVVKGGLEDRTSLADQVYDALSNGFASTATFLIPGLGAGKIASYAPKIKQLATLMNPRNVAASMMALTEAGINAGATRAELIKQGMSEEHATRMAEDQMLMELPANMVLDRIGVFGDAGKRFANRAVRFAGEPAQEALQQVAQNIATASPAGEGVAEAAAIGAVVGPVAGRVADTFLAPGRPADAVERESAPDTTGTAADPVVEASEAVAEPATEAAPDATEQAAPVGIIEMLEADDASIKTEAAVAEQETTAAAPDTVGTAEAPAAGADVVAKPGVAPVQDTAIAGKDVVQTQEVVPSAPVVAKAPAAPKTEATPAAPVKADDAGVRKRRNPRTKKEVQAAVEEIVAKSESQDFDAERAAQREVAMSDEVYTEALDLVKQFEGVVKRVEHSRGTIPLESVAGKLVLNYGRSGKGKSFKDWIGGQAQNLIKNAAREEGQERGRHGERKSAEEVSYDAIAEHTPDIGATNDAVTEHGHAVDMSMRVKKHLEDFYAKKGRAPKDRAELNTVLDAATTDIVAAYGGKYDPKNNAEVEQWREYAKQAYEFHGGFGIVLSKAQQQWIAKLVRKYLQRNTDIEGNVIRPDIVKAKQESINHIIATQTMAGRGGQVLVKYLNTFRKGPQRDWAAYNMILALKSDPSAVWEAFDAKTALNIRMLKDTRDHLSMLIAQHGTPDEDVQRAIVNGMGNYLITKYRMYDDPRYEPSPEAINDLVAEIQASGKTYDEAMTIVRTTLDNVRLEQQMGLVSQHGIPQTSLRKKQKLSPAYRAFLKQIDDPVYLIQRTLLNGATMAFNAQFQGKIANIPGMVSETNTQTNTVSISRRGSEGKSWEGLFVGKPKEVTEVWIPRDVYQFLHEMHTPQASDFVQRYMVAPFKMVHTAMSWPTQARNNWGNAFFHMLAGTAPVTPKALRGWAHAVWVLANRDRDAHAMAEFQSALKSGAIGSEFQAPQVYAAMLRRIDDGVPLLDAVVNNKVTEMATKLYQGTDEFHKLAAYFTILERKGVASSRTAVDAEQVNSGRYNAVSEEAAETINRYFANYVNMPRLVNMLHKYPLAGPFASFAYEATRIPIDAAKHAIKTKDYGAMARVAYALSLPSLLGAISKAMYGVSDDEEKALRSIMPAWLRNGSFVWWRNAEGKLHYFDTSFIWPTGMHEKAIRSLVAQDPNAFSDAVGFLKSPVIDATTVAITGEHPTFRYPLSQPADEPVKQVADRALAIVQNLYLPPSSPIPDVGKIVQGRLEPGPMTGYQVAEIYRALLHQDSKSMYTTDPGSAIRNFALGIKATPVQAKRMLQRTAAEYEDALRKAEQAYSRPIASASMSKTARPDKQSRDESLAELNKRKQRVLDKIQYLQTVPSILDATADYE